MKMSRQKGRRECGAYLRGIESFLWQIFTSNPAQCGAYLRGIESTKAAALLSRLGTGAEPTYEGLKGVGGDHIRTPPSVRSLPTRD